ncbi:MAG TPA: ATP-binding protein [Jatrophihabitans sp.]|nr:ATP-binding protein [Jatrophihabitans sp.]
MGQWRVSADIPATVHGPAAARRVVDAVMRGWRLEPISPDAQLVASELVSNAIQHAPGGDSVELELLRHADSLRISLADGSALKPIVAALDHSRRRGRGMRIVEALASRWGADHRPGGKRVWVDLPLPRLPDVTHPGRPTGGL